MKSQQESTGVHSAALDKWALLDEHLLGGRTALSFSVVMVLAELTLLTHSKSGQAEDQIL